MKKGLLALSILGIIFSSNVVMAESFEALKNLTPTQNAKLTNIHNTYKAQLDSLDNKIMDYKNKIAMAKSDATKTKEQIALSTSVYERNLAILESQKKQIETAMKKSYQSVMTAEQYQQYSAQQIKVENAFNEFVRTAK